jgi:endonuclease I
MKKNAGVLLLATLATAFSACVGFAAVKSINNNEPEVVKASEGDYWSGVDLTGATYGSALRNALYNVMVSKGTATGSNSYKALNTILASSDKLPSGGVCAFYRNDEAASSWNKEHVWPNSRGAGENAGYAGTDPQVIRPTNTSDNSSRSNYMYGETTSPSQSNGWDPNSFGFDGARGEAARIIFYAAVRYKNKASGAGGSYKGSASGLELTENLNDATTNATMGKLSTLMTWNTKYAVTRAETYRNDYLTGVNYARNPFIDHPELAGYIWDGSGTGAYGGTSSNNYIRTVAPTASTSPAVTVASSSVSVNKDATKTVQATAKNFDGTVSWSVSTSASATATATVSSNGLVTIAGVKVGSATITVSASYGGTTKSATIAVTVTSTDPALALASTSVSTSLGSNQTTTITASNFNGTVSYSYSYSTTGVATVSISGGTVTVTPVAIGTTTVTITGSDGTNSASVNLSVTVAAAVTNATITAAGFTASGINGYDTTATSHTVNGVSVKTLYCATFSSVDNGTTIQFKKSQNAYIASATAVSNLSTITLNVSSGTFTVYGSTDGSTWTEITGSNSVYSLNGYAYWKVANDTASTAKLTSLTLAYSSGSTKTLSSIAVTTQPKTTTYTVGDTFSTEGMVVTATYSDNSTAVVTDWTTDSPEMSTAGTKTITVTYSGKSTTFTITVNAASSNPTISLSPSTLSLTAGGANGTSTATLGKSAAISAATSSSTSVATVTYSGYVVTVVPVAAGSCTITVTATNSSGSVTATIAVTVEAASTSTGTYSLVTSASQLSAGKHVLLSNTNTAGSGAYFAGTSDVAYGISRTTLTINSNLTVTPDSSTEEFLLGGSSGAWTFTTTKRTTNGLVYDDSTNQAIVVSSSATSYTTWTIGIASNLATIQNVGDSNYFVYDSTYYFTDGSSDDTMALFVESSSTPSKTLTSLAVTGTPTTISYTAGQSFNSSGLTVTATYDDGTTANVVSSVTWTPSPLTQGTTSVTGTYGGKTVIVSGLTVSAVAAQGTYQLVTSADQLTTGSKYLIGSTATAGTGYFLGNATYSSYYMKKIDNTVYSDKTVTPAANTEILTLGGSTGAFTFSTSQNSTNGKVCNTKSGTHYNLTVKNDPASTDYSTWAITVGADGGATIVSTIGSSSYYMSYYDNSTNQDYSIATSASQTNYNTTLYLYKEIATGTSDLTLAKQWAQTFNSAFANICNAEGNTAVATIQSTWATQYSNFGNLASTVQAYLTASTSTDSDITAMWAKYTYIYNKYSTNLTTSGGDFLSKGSSAYKGEGLKTSSESTAILVVASMMAAGLAGFYLLKKKKAI